MPRSFVDVVIGALREVSIPKHRLLSPLVPPRGSRRAIVFGSSMELDLSDLIQRAIYLGTYEREETRFVKSLLRPGQTVVDVGANVGYYTLLAASLIGPSGRVLAFEPGPLSFRKLRAVKEQNNLTQCTVLNVGLSDINGEQVLYEPEFDSGNLNATMAPQANAHAICVPVRRLDDVLDEYRVSHVDLLKIDVEGHELRVFKGAEGSLCRGVVQAILCEVNEYHLHAQSTNGCEMMAFLRKCGFEAPELALPAGPPPAGHSNYLLFRAVAR